ncbi:MAG: ABC transporter substrate-binding protein [Candidatus Nealsonbacteria bacterium]
MSYKWPSKNQWLQFFKTLSSKERKVFIFFGSLFLFSFIFLSVGFYVKNTEIVPALGSSYIEGVVGFPRFINPVYASLSNADKDLTELIFSGLMRYDENGQLALDMAKDYQVIDNGRIYEFYLKDNLVWQDGRKLTADDIVFTIETIQNPDIKSPLRSIWLGVTVEKISESAVRFTLKNSSSIFLENSTFKIIPKHIWENVSAKNFSFSPNNLKPVGSGPYKFQDLSQDNEGKITSVNLIKNVLYCNEGPYISKISFKFFETEEELIDAYKKDQIKGFSVNSPNNISFCDISSNGLSKCNDSNLYSLYLPRYFAVFFNQNNSKVLSDENVRMALSYGTNKKELIETLFLDHGKEINSPILPDIYGFQEPTKVYEFDIEKAKDILEKAGFITTEQGTREKTVKKELSFVFKSTLTVGSQGAEVKELQKCLSKDPEIYPEGKISGYFGSQTKAAVIKFQEKYKEDVLTPFGLEKGTGDVKSKTREKLNEVCFEAPEEKLSLEFSLYTVDQPLMIKAARALKAQWKELGAKVSVKTFDINSLESEVLRKREFESLLFGEVLSLIPDPFPFWHSSQKGELGLNLANYKNDQADKLLEINRQSLDETERQQKLEEFQNILIKDLPAIFLYNPDYLYIVPENIKGINEKIITDPSKRLTDISTWYIKTRRVWKITNN